MSCSPCRLVALILLVHATTATAGVTTSSGTLSLGTPYETAFYIQKSDKPGPTVVITGGVHGDEPAGAAAAEQVRHWPILRGTLIVLPRANPPGLAANRRNMPGVADDTANLNRNFPKAAESGDARGEPAKTIWKWIELLKPDWSIDLHEGTGIRGAGATSVGSSVIVCPGEAADRMANAMVAAVNATVMLDAKKFVRIAPPVDGSLARAVGEHLHAGAMILETSISDLPQTDREKKKDVITAPKRRQALSLRVRQHRIMLATMLKRLEMIDPTLDPLALPADLAPAGATRVLIFDGKGTGGSGASDVERIARKSGFFACRVDAAEIVRGCLSQADLLVVPGGSGHIEAETITAPGRQNIRSFVQAGGGYVGICAGAYLGSSGFDWSLNLVAAKTVSPLWERGKGRVKVELTSEGNSLLGEHQPLEVTYHNGPILEPKPVAGLPPYDVLAYFRSEVAFHNSPKGIMVNSPAIVASQCGNGRVVLISPHPEVSGGANDLIERALQWAAQRDRK